MLEDLPEEILDRIVFLALIAPSPHPSPHPTWYSRPSAILLTSNRFLRIARHHVYSAVHLATRTKAQLLLRSLQANPSLAPLIQSLTILNVWPEGGSIMALCNGAVRHLDINLERFNESGPVDREYGEGLSKLVGVRHLTVRKPCHVYQSLPRLRYIMVSLAKAIEGWSELETANIAFKLSDDIPTSPVLSSTPFFDSFPLAYPPPPTAHIPGTALQPNLLGPTARLATALAHAPNLHTFTTQLPSVWNLAILTISTNPRLERIILRDASYETSPSSIPCLKAPLLPWRFATYSLSPSRCSSTFERVGGTGLYLMEAKKHPRLSELIRAGRTSANAMGSAGVGSHVDGSGWDPKVNAS